MLLFLYAKNIHIFLIVHDAWDTVSGDTVHDSSWLDNIVT